MEYVFFKNQIIKIYEEYPMTIKIYSYPKCSTCRKAIKFLENAGVAFETLDITVNPPSRSELANMLENSGGDLRKLFNTSGLVYRELQLSAKLPTMSTEDAMKLLASNGKLVKRPFLVVNGSPVAVGFNEVQWKKLLAK